MVVGKKHILVNENTALSIERALLVESFIFLELLIFLRCLIMFAVDWLNLITSIDSNPNERKKGFVSRDAWITEWSHMNFPFLACGGNE